MGHYHLRIRYAGVSMLHFALPKRQIVVETSKITILIRDIMSIIPFQSEFI